MADSSPRRWLWFSQVSVGGGFLTDILGPVAARRGRARLRLRDDDDRRRLGGPRAGVRPRERADQHLAADRRRARTGRAGDDRQLAHRRPDGDGAAATRQRSPNALTEGFQAAFLGGAVIAALGLVLTLVLIRSSDSRAHVELGAGRLAGRELPPGERPAQGPQLPRRQRPNGERCGERLRGRLGGAVDRRLVVGERDEPGLELGRRADRRRGRAGPGRSARRRRGRRPTRRRSRAPARR